MSDDPEGRQLYDRLFNDLWKAAYRSAYFILKNRELAEDCAQHAMLQAWKYPDKLRNYPEAFVRRVAINCALDRVGRSAHHELPDLAAEGGGSPEQAIDIKRCLEALPEELREVVMLRHFEGMTLEEVARILGGAATTIFNHFERAMTLLAACLAGKGHPAPFSGFRKKSPGSVVR